MKLTTDPMELVSLVVSRGRAEEIASYLLHAGIFHPVDIRDIEGELAGLSAVQITQEYDRFERLQQRTAGLSRQMGIDLEPAADYAGLTYEGSEAELKRIDDELTARLVKKEELREAVKSDEGVLAQMPALLPFPLPQPSGYSMLFVALGTLEGKNLQVIERSLGAVPYVVYPLASQKTKVKVLFLGLRRDREILQKVLADAGWQEEDLERPAALSEEEQAALRERIETNRREIDTLDKDISAFKAGNKEELSRISAFAILNKSLAEAKRYAVATDKTVIFSGWVPAEDKERVFREAEGFSETVYVEARKPEETGVAKEDVPVRFGRNPLLKPFGLLVESYGVPRYGTLDPTVFTAISFVFMFGLMFGDLGQGLVFALIGTFLLWKNRNAVIRQFAALLFYCGMSAAVFGFLLGSCFGFEFHSAWSKPMEDVMGILRFSLYGGIVLISTGIVINIVNALRDRDYLRMLFDKSGLIGGLVYWSAIVVISRAMFERAAVPPALYTVIAVGLGALFLFPVVEFFVHRHKGATFFESFMESLLGLLEFGMGYLANTVSFVRMGAFALAHAALFLAVFQIAKMFQGPTNAAVIIFGNIGIMVLEGVVVSIQSLRLNYYEFFSRFFVAGKTLFKPLSV